MPGHFPTLDSEALARLRRLVHAMHGGNERSLPVPALVDLASEVSADLIVIGTRGHTGLKHVLLGSVAERVVRTAPCPVLTVKESWRSRSPDGQGVQTVEHDGQSSGADGR